MFGVFDWVLIFDGDFFGDYDFVLNMFYGLFIFFNGLFDVVSIIIDILSEGFVFDIVFFDVFVNGLGFGYEFVSSDF